MAFPIQSLKQQASQFGFHTVGVTEAKPAPTLDAYLRWIEAGMHGSMDYLARPDRRIRRENLGNILPNVRSIVSVGWGYPRPAIPSETLTNPARGRIASYAWRTDYHHTMIPRLEMLAEWMRAEAGYQTSHRVYVDTGALLERAHAQQAGMGFIGKNTMLIHPRRGSHFFLGEILTDLGFDVYDAPRPVSLCGSCTRCLTACPTGAFLRPYVLDARRCISYLTVEHKGWIDRDLRPLMGNRVFGCDICQDVCPWQRFALPTNEPAFQLPDGTTRAAPLLLDLLNLDERDFKVRFNGSPILRIKRNRLVRNACVAAGNWGSVEAIPILTQLTKDDSPLIRGHAIWALAKIMGKGARDQLAQQYALEQDQNVRQEIKENLRSLLTL